MGAPAWARPRTEDFAVTFLRSSSLRWDRPRRRPVGQQLPAERGDVRSGWVIVDENVIVIDLRDEDEIVLLVQRCVEVVAGDRRGDRAVEGLDDVRARVLIASPRLSCLSTCERLRSPTNAERRTAGARKTAGILDDLARDGIRIVALYEYVARFIDGNALVDKTGFARHRWRVLAWGYLMITRASPSP